MNLFTVSAVLNLDSSRYDAGVKTAQKEAYNTKSALASLTSEIKTSNSAFDKAGDSAMQTGDKIDGLESELKQVNVGLNTTASELNAVTSKFIGAEKSTAALGAENQVLEKYVYDLNDKLEKETELLYESIKAYGEADERTQKYQQAVNNTTAEVNKVNAQIGANTKQIELNEAQTKGLNGILGKVGLNVNDLAQKFGLSSGAANKLTTALGGTTAAVGVFAVALVKVIGKLNEFSKAQAQHIDEINTLARNYHTTAEAMQEYAYMSKLIDVDTQTITGSISRLTRTMGSAKDGTGEAAKAFAALGVDITNADGSLRDSNAVFYETIDALGRINSETEQDAIAMQLFGRSAMELRGMIDEGSDGLKAYAEEANRLGVVLSSEANNRLQSLQDESDKVSAVQNAAKENWAAVWAPAAEFFEGVKGGFFMLANEGAKALIESREKTDDLSEATEEMSEQAKTAYEMQMLLSDGIDGVALSAEDAAKALGKQAAAIEAMTDAERGWRDLNEKNPLDMLPADRAAYTEYLRQANATQEQLGYKIGIANYDTWKTSYDKGHGQQNQPITVSVQLDGREMARAMYDYNAHEKQLRGGTM